MQDNDHNAHTVTKRTMQDLYRQLFLRQLGVLY